jgi:hypothetical protein
MNEAEQIQLAHTRLDISGHRVGKSLKLDGRSVALHLARVSAGRLGLGLGIFKSQLQLQSTKFPYYDGEFFPSGIIFTDDLTLQSL